MDIGIKINNDKRTVGEGISVNDLLKSEGYEGRVSVWINGIQLLAGEYPFRSLESGDEIRILRLAAGG
jgi:thiamine biosynthesis protein ThiS